jgi:hypothetical protein
MALITLLQVEFARGCAQPQRVASGHLGAALFGDSDHRGDLCAVGVEASRSFSRR